MKKLLLGIIALLLISASAQAIRPKRGLIPFTQSDGSVVMVQKEGERHLAFYVSEDGYVLVENAAGDLCYAEIKDNGLVATALLAHSIDKRTDAELAFVSSKALRSGSAEVSNIVRPTQQRMVLRAIHASTTDGLGEYGKSSVGATGTIGDYVIPVLMVQFKNIKFSKMTEEKLTRYLNEEGYKDEAGCSGSVRDYFLSQSRGIFNPRFEVVGTVTLSGNHDVYGSNDSQGIDKGFLEDYKFVTEAIELATKQGVDFSKYARNGKVPNISFFYAGPGEATEGSSSTAQKYIWPHMDDLETTFSGVYFNSYFVGNEIDGDGSLMGMGVFCHEFSHVLGLPDFYCTDYSHDVSPIGEWSIMDYGAYVNDARAPMGYTAYERSYMGWLNIPELKEAQPVTLSSYDSEEGTPAVLIRNPSDKKEYFILENHQPGTWYPSSYGSGLLVMRVAYNQTQWDLNTLNNDENNMRSMLVSANGSTMSGYTSSSKNELWGNANNTKEIKTWTLFNTRTITNKPVLSIVKNNDGTISFNFIKDNFSELVVGDTIRKDGICYVKTAEEELTVVADPKASYSGDVSVPAGFYEDYTDFKVVAIGEAAFAGQTELTSLTLPATVISIADDAFRNTPKLASITIANGNRKYQSTADGVLFNKNSYLNAPKRMLRSAEDGIVTFDFAANPWNLPTSDNSDAKKGNITEPIVTDNVKLTTSDGTAATRLWQPSTGSPELRMYKGGGALKFETTDNTIITKVVFTATQFNLAASEGTLTEKTWTGEAESVTFTAASTNKISKIELSVESGDISPELIHYPAAAASTYTVPDATVKIHPYAFEGANVESLTLPATVSVLDRASLAIPTLSSLTVNMTALPACELDPFVSTDLNVAVDKDACQLIVPASAEPLYRADTFWAPFFTSSPVDGIAGVKANASGSTRIYDLQGRRVQKAEKGIYIIGGKKMVVR